jgi:IS1 family transposase
MNCLPLTKRAQIIGMLAEGMSLRAASRLADVSINTVTKLLLDVGTAAAEYQDRHLRNLPCKRIQCNEIWAFCYAKERNASQEMKEAGTARDIWIWTAICPDTKLIPCWMVGGRDAEIVNAFMDDLADRLAHRVQLSTDGHKAYLTAVRETFVNQIDYAMLFNQYGAIPDVDTARRYNQAECTGAIKQNVLGRPGHDHVSTSYFERANLTMRMGIRRFTRPTNAFSKKVENHAHAVALHFMHYNFGRVHKSLRVTPAMEAGIADHVWSLEEIAAQVKDEALAKRGPYKKAELGAEISN